MGLTVAGRSGNWGAEAGWGEFVVKKSWAEGKWEPKKIRGKYWIAQ